MNNNKQENLLILSKKIHGVDTEITYVDDEFISFKQILTNGNEITIKKEGKVLSVYYKNSIKIGYIAGNSIFRINGNEIIKVYTMNEEEYDDFKFEIHLIESALARKKIEELVNEMKSADERIKYLQNEIEELNTELESYYKELNDNVLSNSQIMEIINTGDKKSLHSIKLYLKYKSKLSSEELDSESINKYIGSSRKCDIRKLKKSLGGYKSRIC